jgi:hypothetical protein
VSFTLFENRVLRISAPKREEVTGGRKNFQSEEFHFSSNIIRRMK